MTNRRNTLDDDGRAWYAVDADREQVVLGPFGSEEYAETCAGRMDWPNELTVARSDKGIVSARTGDA